MTCSALEGETQSVASNIIAHPMRCATINLYSQTLHLVLVQEIATRHFASLILCVCTIPVFCMVLHQTLWRSYFAESHMCHSHCSRFVCCDDKIWPCCSMQQVAKHERKAAAHFTSSTVSTGAAVLRLVCPCPCAGDLALLQHDKPLAKGNSAPHLKHIPAYLRDPTAATPSFPGNAGKGTFPFCKCTVYHPPPPLAGPLSLIFDTMGIGY